jgi:phosphatidate cytidylyltransferase
MLKRFNTSILLVIVLLPLIWLNAFIFSLVVGGFLIVSSYELHTMLKTRYPLRLFEGILYILYNVLIYTGFYLYIQGQLSGAFFINGLLLSVGLWLAYSVFSPQPITYFTSTLAFGIYFSMAYAAVSYIQSLGTTVLLYVLLVTMLSDVFAYLVGVPLGKHKLAPKVSPKKSVEGLMGGLVGAVLVASVYVSLIDVPFPFDPPLSLITLVVISFFVSLAGQLGDLIASKIKRDYDIKDFSNVFPGHGGVLDRFDSTLFASFILVVVFILLGSI